MKKSTKMTKTDIILALKQAGYSYEQTRKVKIIERNIDDLSVVPSDDVEIISSKNKKGQVRTVFEISKKNYRLIKTVWITPESKIYDLNYVMSILPTGEAKKAAENSLIDTLALKFKVTKRGGK